MWPEADLDWPRPYPPSVTVQEFVEVFRDHYGYEVCASSLYEEGFDKIALFVENDVPQHAAVMRRADGRWMSKLGAGIDTVHDGLDIINDFPMEQPHGPCTGYGTASYFFKKRRSQGIGDLADSVKRFLRR